LESLRWIALGIRFLLELVTLVAFSHWGMTREAPAGARLALAVAAPLVVVLIWGALIAPKASVPWSQQVRNALGLLVFLGAAATLFLTGRATMGWVMAGVATIDTAVLIWRRW